MGLRLVDFDPNDYKLGEVLASKDGETLTGEDKISAVLSLYFQWPSDSSAFAYFDLPGRPSFKIELDYDKEERTLTQLMLSLPVGVSLQSVAKAFIRIDVFNGCYEFESQIIDSFQDGVQWLVVAPPNELKSIKVRRSTRVNVLNELKAKFETKDGIEDVCLTSLTLNGFVLNRMYPKGTLGTLHLENLSLKTVYARDIEEKSAFALIFESDIEASLYFDFYRQTAYPNLTPRSEVDSKELYDLFVESGFFGNFGGKFDEADRSEKAQACWDDLKEAQHHSTADYVIQENSKLLGSSSCALAYKKQENEYWVFHQLCAKKDTDTLDLTGDLYSWRAEYLWNRKSNITSVFWFRSESRWLERIYVKYAMQSPERGEVKPAQLFAYIHKTENFKVPKALTQKYGKDSRSYYDQDETQGGLGPDYVHINRNMNIIQGNGNWEKIFKAAEAMTASLNRESAYFRIVMPSDCPPPELSPDRWDYQNSVNRHAEIKKEGMLDFIACLRHSIAVTKRKHSKAG